MNINIKKIDMRDVQEQMGDGAKSARDVGRKATLASLGLVGIAYDTGKAFWNESVEFASRAEKRGEEVEKLFFDQLEKFQSQRHEDVRELRSEWTKRANSLSSELTTRGKDVESELKSVLDMLRKLGRAPAGPKVDKITIEVDVEHQEPFAGYDEMNVQEVLERVEGMDAEKRAEVRAYELANKNRISILRELEMETA